MEKHGIFLRAFESDDYMLINQWRNNPEIQKLVCGTSRYVSSEREKEWVKDKIINNHHDIYLAICLNDETKKMIGYTSINQIDHIHRTAFGGGIVIGDKEYRNGSYMIDTFLNIFLYVFEELNINRFSAACLEIHKTSRVMLEMLGFKLEGVSREMVYKHGKYNNRCEYSLLASEYFEKIQNDGYSEICIARQVKEIVNRLNKK